MKKIVEEFLLKFHQKEFIEATKIWIPNEKEIIKQFPIKSNIAMYKAAIICYSNIKKWKKCIYFTKQLIEIIIPNKNNFEYLINTEHIDFCYEIIIDLYTFRPFIGYLYLKEYINFEGDNFYILDYSKKIERNLIIRTKNVLGIIYGIYCTITLIIYLLHN